MDTKYLNIEPGKAGKTKAQRVGTRYHIAESNLQDFMKGGRAKNG